MLFSSLVFLWIFLPCVIALYFIVPRAGKNAVLLIASLFFYAWGEPVYVLLMLGSITLNWVSGLALSVVQKKAARSWVLFGAIAANLGLLAYFKYFDFFAKIGNAVLGGEAIALRSVVLPLGISFYTFQALSYVIDYYRGEIPVQKNWFLLALYISFFPQLVAGPIVRYSDIEHQLAQRETSWEAAAYGVKRFLYGLAKKVLLANTFARTADDIFGLAPEQMSTAVAWLGTILYTLQIYYDFSGYSDMAIGLGKLFGFTFPENFNYPYISASVQEFWRRWHMTLSGWFRSYLYIPLGGNRKGMARTLINLLVVFACTGLWHGASWQFVAWGLYHGMFLLIERVFLGKWLAKRGVKPLAHIYTTLVFTLGWVLFRAPGLHAALGTFRAMLLPTAGSAAFPLGRFLDAKLVLLLVLGILGCGIVQTVWPRVRARLYDETRVHVWECVYQFALFFLCVMNLVSSTYNPFIYFRF